MSRIYKRGKRYYYRKGYLFFSLQTENKRRAEEIKRHLDNKYELERFGIFTSSSKTLFETLKEWMNFIAADKSDSWWKNNIPKINKFKSYIGDIPVMAITTAHINNFIGMRKNEGKAPNTIHGDFKPVRQFFDWAVSNSYIQKNPVKTAIFPQIKVIRERHPIPSSVLQDIFAKADEKDGIFWQVCYYTGLDSAEAGTLEKNHIKNGVIYKTRNKTKVPVPIPLHPKLLKLKDSIFNIYPEKFQRDNSNKRFKKLCAGHNIYGVVKSLRHSFISHLFDHGLSLEDIKVVAGHTSQKMTAHYTEADLKKISDTLQLLA